MPFDSSTVCVFPDDWNTINSRIKSAMYVCLHSAVVHSFDFTHNFQSPCTHLQTTSTCWEKSGVCGTADRNFETCEIKRVKTEEYLESIMESGAPFLRAIVSILFCNKMLRWCPKFSIVTFLIERGINMHQSIMLVFGISTIKHYTIIHTGQLWTAMHCEQKLAMTFKLLVWPKNL